MIGIKLLTFSTFLFFQGIYTFCVYNELTDGSSFRVSLTNSVAGTGRTFTKHMEKGTIMCCPYTSRDCSRNLKNDDEARFRLNIYFIDGSSTTRTATCTTSGALVIRGAVDDYHGECVDATGLTTMFLLPKEHTYGSPAETTKSA